MRVVSRYGVIALPSSGDQDHYILPGLWTLEMMVMFQSLSWFQGFFSPAHLWINKVQEF